MDARPLSIAEVVEITPKLLRDARGYFTETFRDDWFQSTVAPVTFVQENQSLSMAQGTIRGLHFQSPPFAQGKLVRCVQGAIFDVAVDLRAGSPDHGRWVAVTLTPETCNQLWIPAGFAHGFCTLAPNSIVAYKVTNYYSRDHDLGVAWDDRDIGITWPEEADPATLSAKDGAQPGLGQLPHHFTFEGGSE